MEFWRKRVMRPPHYTGGPMMNGALAFGLIALLAACGEGGRDEVPDQAVIDSLRSDDVIAVNSRAQIEWITESTNPGVWSRISNAFAQEVRDSLSYRPPFPPRGIEYVALQDSTALVFVRYAYSADTADWYPPMHRIYSYRLVTGQKHLVPRTITDLEIEGVAFFDVSAPDIVFRHLSCFECEATRLLSSVQYDNDEWSLRTWVSDGEASQSVMIGSSQQYGDYLWRFACAHRIWDRDSDGADELAVYCRWFGHDRETEELKVQRDHVLWFDLVNGQMEGGEVDSPEFREELYLEVCASSPTSNLCSN